MQLLWGKVIFPPKKDAPLTDRWGYSHSLNWACTSSASSMHLRPEVLNGPSLTWGGFCPRCSIPWKPTVRLSVWAQKGLEFGTSSYPWTFRDFGCTWRVHLAWLPNHDKSRYLHPREMFLLQGGSPAVEWGQNLRLAMAGIGQCVSPIHAVWILSQLRVSIQTFCGEPCIDETMEIL